MPSCLHTPSTIFAARAELFRQALQETAAGCVTTEQLSDAPYNQQTLFENPELHTFGEKNCSQSSYAHEIVFSQILAIMMYL